MDKRSIVHVEIPAKDREASARFFHEVFGWEYEHAEQPAPYTLFRTGNIGGGLPDVQDFYQPGHVILYVDSDDIQADLDRIEAAGGKALSSPFMVGDFGEMAFVADPAGNRLALWREIGSQPQP